ncbi:GntR family transcriptional regulator [Roseinatronobacter monicus]|uniref:GntR family transcriptional regulator n=1 Tax=Roseinatronobacter monicus TaxID=393481 RepID=A0A543KH05_9RHOB|nr:GntR family transcriptional regulator [Roseinatronobacter monicus]TQM94359.1 GntR family transcriptional regulator [Roseinatronobacter monicus]
MQNTFFSSLDTLRGPSATDLVFEEIYRRVVEFELPPGTKLSEQEVARQMGISRQPVRDAFFRMSQLGLIQIQPQRATTVSLISVEAVLRANFVRTALETEIVERAVENLTDEAIAELAENVENQRHAVAAADRIGFHALDEAFHQQICTCAGHSYVWAVIRENKAHMDRVRLLSLGFNAPNALADHERILEALRARDAARASGEMRIHLAGILDLIEQIRAENPTMFASQDR